MTATTETPIRYRKTKTGQWVAFGPADRIHAGATVTVAKRDGSTKVEYVESVGRPFTVDGQQMVYGYLATRPSSFEDTRTPLRANLAHQARRSQRTRSRCDTCRCHREFGPRGDFDGCDWCGCDGDM
jgi:hypothetical protein